TNYSSFNVSEFYNEFIEKDIFYNYHLAFYTNHYSIPKGIFGVRKFQFSSFQMLLIYYAIGFYFYEILNETFISINEVKKVRGNIKTYYGGNINFNKPAESKIYYQNDYSEFTSGIKNK